MSKDTKSNAKLGMFIIGGLVVFILAIYFIGKQQNLFGSTIQLKSKFKNVSGLKVGNNVRFSGINIGTVSDIELVNDSSVVVIVSIQKDVQKFIKTDAIASIGSDGLVGDKVFTISPGSVSTIIVKEDAFIASKSPLEIEDFMKSIKKSADNAEIVTAQLAEFTYNMNHGNGALAKLMSDKGFAKDLDATMSNLKTGTKGLSENMEAAKHNFFLKGFFKKKEKAAADKKKEQIKKEEKAEKELKEKKEKIKDSLSKK